MVVVSDIDTCWNMKFQLDTKNSYYRHVLFYNPMNPPSPFPTEREPPWYIVVSVAIHETSDHWLVWVRIPLAFVV